MQQQTVKRDGIQPGTPGAKSPQSGQRTVIRQSPPRRPEPVEEDYYEDDVPEEPVYKADQVQIAIICDTIESVLRKPEIQQFLSVKELYRIDQARLMLYIMAGMPELIPRQPESPPASQTGVSEPSSPQQGNVTDHMSDDQLIDELDRTKEGEPALAVDENVQTDPLQTIHNKIDIIKDGGLTEPEPEEPKEGGLKGILAKIKGKEPVQPQKPKQVKEEYQSTSIG